MGSIYKLREKIKGKIGKPGLEVFRLMLTGDDMYRWILLESIVTVRWDPKPRTQQLIRRHDEVVEFYILTNLGNCKIGDLTQILLGL